MPLGVVEDDDFFSQVNNTIPSGSVISTPGSITPIPEVGRKEGDNNVPPSLRKIIGESSNLDGRAEALEIAKEFNISSSSVSAYANGATSTASYNSPDTDLQTHINKAKLRASKRASMKLLKALNHITDEKLENAKVGDLAVVAKAMSGIVKDMEGNSIGPNGGTPAAAFIFYSPRPIHESQLPIINVQE